MKDVMALGARADDWQRHIIPYRQELTEPMYLLEIGVYEGGSACWWLDNVLTGPDDRYVGIDPWDIECMTAKTFPKGKDGQRRMQQIEDMAREALEPYAEKVTLVKACSQDVLRPNSKYSSLCPFKDFHLAYIDGAHKPREVVTDSVYVWPRVIPGGIVIWDDYRRTIVPRRIQVHYSIAPFLEIVKDQCDILWDNIQLGVRKHAART